MATPFHSLDLSSSRRILVAGDIHGRLDLLLRELRSAHYDAKAGDQLILLGDLLDRGPDVLEIYVWLQDNPEVLRVRGNHDDMLIAAVGLKPSDDYANAFNLIRNGGGWLLDYASNFNAIEDLMCALIEDDEPARHLDPDIVSFAKFLADAPIAIEALTPSGNKAGFVHADVIGDWAEFTRRLTAHEKKIVRSAMWTRHRFDAVKEHLVRGRPRQMDCTVDGIDHVFFGHSITKEPMTHSNCTWIDTGAYKSEILTVVDVDQTIERARTKTTGPADYRVERTYVEH